MRCSESMLGAGQTAFELAQEGVRQPRELDEGQAPLHAEAPDGGAEFGTQVGVAGSVGAPCRSLLGLLVRGVLYREDAHPGEVLIFRQNPPAVWGSTWVEQAVAGVEAVQLAAAGAQ